MNTEKDRIGTVDTDKNAETAAAEATTAENMAKTEEDISTYTHTFSPPFPFQGVPHETLTFNWGALTGADHLAIENELLFRGKTLVTPEFTGDFLCGMAVRACVDRNPDGLRTLDQDGMKSLPMRDFQKICKKARAFLLRAGS